MEHIKKLPLGSLKCFYFTAEQGSLTAAAAQLHVTHGAVSKQIKQLEAHLDTALFVKRGRHLHLTPAGETLYQRCRPLFDGLNDALAKLKQSRRRDLVVSCEPTLAMKWLIPSIGRFPAEYGFQIVILAAGGKVDFGRQAVDVAIRRNDFDWPPNWFAERLADERTGPVYRSNPSQCKRLHTHTRPDAWVQWEKQPLQHDDLPDDAPENALYFEHFYLSIQAAIAGLGCAIASEWMVREEIRQGILTAPHGFRPDGSAYYLLSETAFEADPRKQLFLDWLKTQMHI